MAKETAEQKLLKALQKKSAAPGLSSTKKSSTKTDFKFSLSIFDFNKILLVGIVVCFVVLLFQLRSGFALLNKELDLADDLKTPRQEEVRLPMPKDIKFYINSFGSRNIFKPYDISLGKAAQGQPNLVKRLNKYKLVGVAWLDLPESASVMIEDTESKATYFLKTGEQLEGVTIKLIYTDRVVFSYEHEETTIKL